MRVEQLTRPLAASSCLEGINYIAGEEQYTLKTLPEIDTKIPLDAAYRDARAMFDAGASG